MLTNASVTIYHKIYNPETRLDEYTSIQYPKANWYGKQAAVPSDKGLITADAYIVRIPGSSKIVVEPGDIVVRGLVDEQIFGPSDVAKMGQSYFTVTFVRDNRRGSAYVQHWKIEGK